MDMKMENGTDIVFMQIRSLYSGRKISLLDGMSSKN
jgi:hypothetical protein